MLKRFRADIAFESSDPLNDLVEEARRRIGGGVVINEGGENEERGYFSVEDCGHNDTPPTPCVITEKWEVGRGKVI